MKDAQWEELKAVVRGEKLNRLPTGFIIDSPWLPNWAGHSILDYFTSESIWFASHRKAHEAFPGTWFLPGFWSEFGMCTEPSAFGAVSMWTENEFPFAKKVLLGPEEIDRLECPNPRRDGLLPFVVKRLTHHRNEIERDGYKIRFAVARGPLNIASFLMGTTEFLTALKTEPERAHRLLGVITDFLVQWIAFQRESIDSIDGLLVLDDLVGFVGKSDFQTFALPYLKKVFDLDVTVKFFHNDAPCKVAAPYLPEVGINLLNFGVQHSLSDMASWTQHKLALLGNVPPRDVLAQGTPAEVRDYTCKMIEALGDRSRLIVSCAGGMPPGTPTENIQALLEAAQSFSA